MITPLLRERIKTTLGNHYLAKVLQELDERGIKNQKGEKYKKSIISMVLNGKRDNQAIKDTIIAVYEKALDIQNQSS